MKKNVSIVLVDDDSVDNFISKKLLESFGITDIIVFENPILAQDYITKRANPLDILIVDLHMPLLNGFELIEKYKESNAINYASNIFILSVSINPNDIMLAKEKGIVFLEKPLSKEKLKEILDGIV